MTRLLIDPKASMKSINTSLKNQRQLCSTPTTLQARRLVGFKLGSRTTRHEMVRKWHRGYIGNPNILGAMPSGIACTELCVELLMTYETTIGFVGDALDSGFQVVEWNEERSIVSSRTLDLVESDEPVIIQPSKTYTLDAKVVYQGTTSGNRHSVGYTAYDADGRRIEPKHVERYGSSADTRLAIDLKPGDTSFEVLDASAGATWLAPRRERSPGMVMLIPVAVCTLTIATLAMSLAMRC